VAGAAHGQARVQSGAFRTRDVAIARTVKPSNSTTCCMSVAPICQLILKRASRVATSSSIEIGGLAAPSGRWALADVRKRLAIVASNLLAARRRATAILEQGRAPSHKLEKQDCCPRRRHAAGLCPSCRRLQIPVPTRDIRVHPR
jgi:hypothetical protein